MEDSQMITHKLDPIQQEAVEEHIKQQRAQQIAEDARENRISWAQQHPKEYRENALQVIINNPAMAEQITNSYIARLATSISPAGRSK